MKSHRSLKRNILMILLGLAISMLATAVAYAHAELFSAFPEPGSVVSSQVERIELVFTESISDDSQIILFGDNFQAISDVQTQFDPAAPAALSASVPDLVDGSYTVQYTAVSVDGHEIGGSYAFQVSANSLFVSGQQIWLLGLGILLMAGVVVLWRRSRHR